MALLGAHRRQAAPEGPQVQDRAAFARIADHRVLSPSTPILRVGIVGAGFGARVHLPALASLAGLKVSVLADSGSGRAAAAAPAGVRPVSGWAELVAAADVDAVVVAVP
ncbi:MAG: Gfo/Idh/MocA family oxidoreductase, partial [Magnetospirillum sp.]|nr:Gfo/Idh/MocA family oxidoreductase [Magnetospirillum sp.]